MVEKLIPFSQFLAMRFLAMNRTSLILSALSTLLLALAGCERSGNRAQALPTNAAAGGATNPTPGFMPTNAQPKLQTIKLWLGPQEITAELALSLPQIMTGMMFRKTMAENEGMLFVFGRPHRA